MAQLTTAELANRLGVTRRRAAALASDGSIPATRLSSGAWLIHSDAVARFEKTAQRTAGRTLGSDASWAILWELSGLEVNWLSESTHARVRRRIRNSDAATLAAVVQQRTIVKHYVSANTELASRGLIKTARAAVVTLSDLGVDLSPDPTSVAGYVSIGSIDEHAAKNFMLQKHDGTDVLYENTLPFIFDQEFMPAAVVAADLTRSLDTREYSAGVRALGRLRELWLTNNRLRGAR